MKNITPRLSRDGKFWLVYVPEIDHHTQGRTVKDAQQMAVDLTATVLNIPVEDVRLADTVIELPDDVRALLEDERRHREQATKENRQAALASRAAALRLREAGLTMRDIGTSLGVSFQRAHQLIND